MYVVLIKNLKFKSVCGKDMDLPSGSKVYVDMRTMVAYANGVHFDIDCTDFTQSH